MFFRQNQFTEIVRYTIDRNIVNFLLQKMKKEILREVMGQDDQKIGWFYLNEIIYEHCTWT